MHTTYWHENTNDWSKCESMCRGKGKPGCVDVRPDGGKYLYTCHEHGCQKKEPYDCSYDETRTEWTSWTTGTPSIPSGGNATGKRENRTTYSTPTGWSSVQTSSYPQSYSSTRKPMYSTDGGRTWSECSRSGCPK